jgi:hypothetical protein
VYIVARGQEEDQSCKQQLATTPDEEEEEDLGEMCVGASESLLSLVQPEMVTLSKHWLAALKDHAILSLPQGNQDKGDF